MKELVIISGKGGTGKTSLTAAFASLAKSMVLCDADVDAADLYLILNPKIKERNDFKAGNKAFIQRSRCAQCGLCISLCKYNAIASKFEVDPLSCEGCGVCVYFCPEKAIEFPENFCGKWFISETRLGPFVHAQLDIAAENSGKMVTLIRQTARHIAEKNNLDLILTDGPPGIGCPVIASIGGASAVIAVTEPTVSGQHDLERVIELTRHFNVKTFMIMNKYDLNTNAADDIIQFAQTKGVPCLGQIPFDTVFTEAMIKGLTIFEYKPSSQGSLITKAIWEKLLTLI